MSMTHDQIQALIDANILTGGNRTSAFNARTVFTAMLQYIDDAVNAAVTAITATGTNTYSAPIANLISYSQIQDVIICVDIVNANTGPSTIDFGLGAIPMVKFGVLPLELNDLKVHRRILGAYDGTNFQIISITGNIAEGN